jgi:ubiquinol-cytochrome c reductase iron-sulfur subunit
MDDSNSVDLNRRKFLGTATTILGTLGLASIAVPFLRSWLPSSRTLAQGGSVEVDISQLPEGGLMTIPWRGQPIWILRRTVNELNKLTTMQSFLKDPSSSTSSQPDFAKNEHRSLRPEILVLVGICTHLGCVPSYKPEIGSLSPDWQGGFYCPCHGSKYDLSGRVYKGAPAPENLAVPPYQFLDKNKLLIG